MGKITKGGEYSIGTPPYKKRKIKRKISRNVRTRKEIIDDGHSTLQPMVYTDKISEREKARQQKSIDEPIIDNCTHEESIVDTDGSLVCRMCGIRIEKKKDRKEIFYNLFCAHKNTIEKNGFLICVKCKGKLKKVKK